MMPEHRINLLNLAATHSIYTLSYSVQGSKLHIEYETIQYSAELLGLTLEQARDRLELLRRESLRSPSESSVKELKEFTRAVKEAVGL